MSLWNSCPWNSFLNDFHIDQHGRLGPTIFGPVDDILALAPLFAGLVRDLRQTVAVLGILAADQISYHWAFSMAVIGGDGARLQDDRPYLHRVAFECRYLRPK